MRNLEAESIRSRMESTGEKLKTFTEIRRNNAHDKFFIGLGARGEIETEV